MPQRKRQSTRSGAASSQSVAVRRGKKRAQRSRHERRKNDATRLAQPQSVKATLPGEMYLRAGRWWWRTRLPGEERPKARALKAPGTKAASQDREEAERIAVEMWEHAIRQDESRHIMLESEQKVERLKAQFLDKVQSLTEIVRGANAKAEAEAQARAEIEARLNTTIQASAEEEHKPAPTGTDGHGPAQTEATVTAGEDPPPSTTECHDPPQTGTCECCGVEGIPETDLECIDSGQLLCPDCLKALHGDISRIDSCDFADSRK